MHTKPMQWARLDERAIITYVDCLKREDHLAWLQIGWHALAEVEELQRENAALLEACEQVARKAECAVDCFGGTDGVLEPMPAELCKAVLDGVDVLRAAIALATERSTS